jgi:hypothetical protein
MPPSDLADLVASLTDGPEPRHSDLTYFAAGYTELRYEHWQKASPGVDVVSGPAIATHQTRNSI